MMRSHANETWAMLRCALVTSAGAIFSIATGPTDAIAHGGLAAVAWPINPEGVGEIADTSYTFRWVDSDQMTLTGTATVDWFYTSRIPPTFPQGGIPPDLEGTPIVLGVPETDTANEYTWDTRGVPPGTYWLWSIVNEPPSELGSIQIVAFSPGVITIAHPGDEIAPAVIIKRPDSPYRWADESYDVEYAAFDPDRSGTVRLEAALASQEGAPMLLAEGLSTSTTTFHWDTSSLPEGDWLLRATLTDARRQSFSAYGRFFLLIVHAGRPDAGSSAVGTHDSGTDLADAGASATDDAERGAQAKRSTEPNAGCTCQSSPGRRRADAEPLFVAAVLLLAVLSEARRWRGHGLRGRAKDAELRALLGLACRRASRCTTREVV